MPYSVYGVSQLIRCCGQEKKGGGGGAPNDLIVKKIKACN